MIPLKEYNNWTDCVPSEHLFIFYPCVLYGSLVEYQILYIIRNHSLLTTVVEKGGGGTNTLVEYQTLDTIRDHSLLTTVVGGVLTHW